MSEGRAFETRSKAAVHRAFAGRHTLSFGCRLRTATSTRGRIRPSPFFGCCLPAAFCRATKFLTLLLGICLALSALARGAYAQTPAPAPSSSAGAASAPAQPDTSQAPSTGDAAAPSPTFASPTDQTPPEVPLPVPMHVGTTATVGGAVDTRYLATDHGLTNQIYLNDAEIDVTYPLVHHGVTHGNVVLQAIGEDPPYIHDGADVEFGNAYVIYKLPLPPNADATSYVKVGQFQIPFALLAVYDPHLQISQPLYSESLGVRNDWGIAFSGRFYSVLNYDFAVTRGVGPSVIGQVDPTQVVTFRLGRTFETRAGVINVGGSLLQGRLPNTDITDEQPYAVELPASGRVRVMDGYVNKSRIAGDGTLLFKRITARGEAIEGADNDSRVLGYYAMGEYMVRDNVGAIIARSYWQYPDANSFSSDDQVGGTYAMSTNVTWRVLYESLLDRAPELATLPSHRFTVQLLFRF